MATFAVATICVCVTEDVDTAACAVDAVPACVCMSAVPLAELVDCCGSVLITAGEVHDDC